MFTDLESLMGRGQGERATCNCRYSCHVEAGTSGLRGTILKAAASLLADEEVRTNQKPSMITSPQIRII